MAGLYAPLPTLRRRPRGRLRTARGRCGSLLLHRSGLAPQTPCRSPGALTRVAARTLAQSPICDRLHRGLQPFRHLHDCSGCFRLERLPGGACTHWNAPPSHGAHVERTQQIAGGRREVLPSNGRPGTGGLRPKRTCVPPAGTSRPLQSVATRTLPPEGRHILVVRFAVVAEIDRRGRTTRFRSTGASGADELRPRQREIRKRARAWQRARTYGASKNESMDWARQPSDRSSIRHSMSLGSVTGRPRSEGRRALAYAIKS